VEDGHDDPGGEPVATGATAERGSASALGVSEDSVLEVNDLSIRFGANQVITDVSFRVDRGTSVAIIGPNGAGKTVLCRALIGSIPYEGEIQWAPGVRIGYVPQKLDLERDLPITGADFLQMFALTIALGLRYLGVLLMGALIMIPAAIAKRLATNLNGMLVIAVTCAVVSTVAGSSVAAWLHRETGPFIVLAATAGFLVSLAWRRS
jgi:energy-coupling factor transporter ATP-binding protein EcfA2